MSMTLFLRVASPRVAQRVSEHVDDDDEGSSPLTGLMHGLPHDPLPAPHNPELLQNPAALARWEARMQAARAEHWKALDVAREEVGRLATCPLARGLDVERAFVDAGAPELFDGGEEISADQGYGPTRFLSPEEVASMHARLSTDAFLRAFCRDDDPPTIRALADALLATIAEAASSRRGLIVGVY